MDKSQLLGNIPNIGLHIELNSQGFLTRSVSKSFLVITPLSTNAWYCHNPHFHLGKSQLGPTQQDSKYWFTH